MKKYKCGMIAFILGVLAFCLYSVRLLFFFPFSESFHSYEWISDVEDWLMLFFFAISIVNLLFMLYSVMREDILADAELESSLLQLSNTKADSASDANESSHLRLSEHNLVANANDSQERVKKVGKKFADFVFSHRSKLREKAELLKKKEKELAVQMEKAKRAEAEWERWTVSCARNHLYCVFYNHGEENIFKLKILIRIAQESEKYSYALELDDVLKDLRNVGLTTRDKYAVKDDFDVVFPNAIKRFKAIYPNLIFKEELYIMLTALDFPDIWMRKIFSVSSEGLGKIRKQLCIHLKFTVTSMEQLDDKIRELLSSDKKE